MKRHVATIRESAGECLPDCGKCCDPVVLPMSPFTAQTWYPATAEGREAKRFLLHDLTPLQFKDGLAKAPHMAAALRHGAVASSLGGTPGRFWFYQCRHYDPESKRCTNYDGRPSFCRDYPWGTTGPRAEAVLPFGCGFLADIPEELQHAMYREER